MQTSCGDMGPGGGEVLEKCRGLDFQARAAVAEVLPLLVMTLEEPELGDWSTESPRGLVWAGEVRVRRSG